MTQEEAGHGVLGSAPVRLPKTITRWRKTEQGAGLGLSMAKGTQDIAQELMFGSAEITLGRKMYEQQPVTGDDET